MKSRILGGTDDPGLLALGIAGIAIAFSIWQFRIQLDKVLRPDFYFANDTDRERRFHKRQAFRRTQIAVLAGLFGVCMLLGLYVSPEARPSAWGIVWTLALLFLAWGGILTLVDALSIRLHFGAELDKRRAEKIALDYKMRRFQEQSLKELDEAKKLAEAEENESTN